MRLLLDTHVLIWLVQGNERLAMNARAAIRDAETLSVSIASFWEIAIKKSIGKLDLEQTATEIEDFCFRGDVAVLPITAGALDRIGQLPDVRRDPFDQLLVATALEDGLALVTNDANIRRYDVPTLWDEVPASDEVKTTADDDKAVVCEEQ